MQKIFTFLITFFYCLASGAQTPKTYTSSEILLQLKKLNVLGSVLYIAAHPDDENTRLLAYLANEKLYRTGYLSLTRGDGGQNLIGDEQGIDLGLIRTQELLSARRIDGAEQFFSRAYDFGFCKSSEEALATWGHDKILSDAVWVIRKFRPDVIICRFPEDARAGHGHHAASGIIAREAFDAAADSTKFPEQLHLGVSVWQAKRMLWNTFNFGGNSTQNESQFKVDVGIYNPLLGKSYGEIAALSRSQHKSQGFGVPAQRGTVLEYFETIRGDKPVNDLMDGVDVSWKRLQSADTTAYSFAKRKIDSIIKTYQPEYPELSIKPLTELRNYLMGTYKVDYSDSVITYNPNNYISIKLAEIEKMIGICSGIFMEVTAVNQLNTIGDSIKLNVAVNNRTGISVDKIEVNVFGSNMFFNTPGKNQNLSKSISSFINASEPFSQPYWLESEKEKGSFTVTNQGNIGQPQIYPYQAVFSVYAGKNTYHYSLPVLYKYTDPIKGELYEPIQFVEPFFLNTGSALVLLKNDEKKQQKEIRYSIQPNISITDSFSFKMILDKKRQLIFDSSLAFTKGVNKEFRFTVNSDSVKNNSTLFISPELSSRSLYEQQYFSLHKINYDHIPDVFYNYIDGVKVIKLDLKTAGTTVGYIPGAGDKVPQALEQMGYKVTILKQSDITPNKLKQFDAIVSGVRAYNTNDWMNNVYDELMSYVNDGGVLVVQYNTSSQIGPVKAKIAPYPFNISRNRITDENAKVNFLLPDHPVLNYPNKITDKDFDGWIQERSIYNTEQADSNYQKIFSMTDVGETIAQDGSLIVANYGKGKFVYTGLVFFRELPAGVPGAYRLFANLLAPPLPPASSHQGKTLKGSLPKPAKIKGKTTKD